MGDENRAWVLTCLSVGAVLPARAQASEVARDKVLDAALEHALGLLSASGAVLAASGPGPIAQLQCSASSVRLSLRQVSP
ncbi:hypothetical protein ACPA9J_01480 [Pseudomonas aeruginosa]